MTHSTRITFSCALVVVAIAIVGPLYATAAAGGNNNHKKEDQYFRPLTYFLGEWNVRPSGTGFGEMFNLPPFKLQFERAGMAVHDGVLVGSLKIQRDTTFFGAALLDEIIAGGEEGVDFNKKPSEVMNPADVEDNATVARAPAVLYVPFRLEADSSLMGGVVILGEGHEFSEEDQLLEEPFVPVKGPADDEGEGETTSRGKEEDQQPTGEEEDEKKKSSSRTTTSSSSIKKPTTLEATYQFHQSVGNFHPFKNVLGRCPHLPPSDGKEVGPMAEWLRLVRESNALLLQNGGKPASEDESVVLPHVEDADAEAEVVAPWRWCSSYQLTVLNHDVFQLTVVLTDDSVASFSGHRHKVDPNAQKTWASFGYTVAFLIFVAAIKFGPKYYFKWKGVDPKMFQPGSKMDNLRRKIEKLTPEERKELLAKQREVLKQMEKDGLLDQENAQRKLVADNS